jgi:hypothetical protein
MPSTINQLLFAIFFSLDSTAEAQKSSSIGSLCLREMIGKKKAEKRRKKFRKKSEKLGKNRESLGGCGGGGGGLRGGGLGEMGGVVWRFRVLGPIGGPETVGV